MWIKLSSLKRNTNIKTIMGEKEIGILKMNAINSIAIEGLFVTDPPSKTITLSISTERSHHHINSSWPWFSSVQLGVESSCLLRSKLIASL